MGIKDLFNEEEATRVTGGSGGGGGRKSVPSITQQADTPSGSGGLLTFSKAFVLMYNINEGLGWSVDAFANEGHLVIKLTFHSSPKEGNGKKVCGRSKKGKGLYLSFTGILAGIAQQVGAEVNVSVGSGSFDLDFDVDDDGDYPVVYMQYPDNRVTIR